MRNSIARGGLRASASRPISAVRTEAALPRNCPGALWGTTEVARGTRRGRCRCPYLARGARSVLLLEGWPATGP